VDRLQKVTRRGAGGGVGVGRKGKSPSSDSLDMSTGLILQSPGSSIAGKGCVHAQKEHYFCTMKNAQGAAEQVQGCACV
jgi:hypothetical protein